MTHFIRPGLSWGAVALAFSAPFPVAANEPLTVTIVTAEQRTIAIEHELTGTIEATHSVPVSFRNGGRIVSLTVDVGDQVKSGMVLGTVDATQPNALNQAAEAQLTAAEASLTQARLARGRVAQLLERGASTQSELLEAEEALLTAAAARDQAQAQLNMARQSVSDTVIQAPFDGIITDRSAEQGQIAGAAQPVLTIAPEKQRDAVFHAPNVRQLSTMMGLGVIITPLDMPGQSWQATITEISPLADIQTGTVTVKAQLGEETPGLGIGEPVSSTVVVATVPVISLPWSALVTAEGRPAVWTVDLDTRAVSLTGVEVARYTSETVEIAAGLKDGDQIVAAGSHLLYPGRIVRAAGEEQ